MIQETKSNIIGPISKEDWIELINIRATIKLMRDSGDDNYFEAIEQYSKLYDSVWSKYFPKAA